MRGWKTYRLEELSTDVAMGPFGSNLKADNFISKGIPVIRGANLNDGGFDDKYFVFVSEEKAQSLKRSLAYADELVFTHRGTLGQVGIIPHSKYPYYLVSQSQMRLSVKKELVDPRFLYYWFKSPVGQHELLKNSSQVGVPSIASPTRSLKEIVITIPSLETQREIASILSTLDDKIELNNQINKNLEAMALAIFKHWFIDFEFPNEQGKPYRSSGGKMVDSELGEVPQEWEPASLLEFANLIGGGTPKTSVDEFWNGTIKWISAKDVTPNSGTLLIETERKITESGLRGSSAKLLPPGCTIITARGTVGNYCMIPEPMTISQSNYALKNKKECDYFQFLLTASLIENFKRHSYGTVFDTITTQTLKEIRIPHYPWYIVEGFEEGVKTVYSMLLNNLLENQSFSRLKSMLLPKLMSGELAVRQVDISNVEGANCVGM